MLMRRSNKDHDSCQARPPPSVASAQCRGVHVLRNQHPHRCDTGVVHLRASPTSLDELMDMHVHDATHAGVMKNATNPRTANDDTRAGRVLTRKWWCSMITRNSTLRGC